MVAVQIRDVPDETRDALARLAGRRGQSLQAYLLDLVNGAALRERRLAILEEIDRERQGVVDTGTGTLDAIHEARRERDVRLMGYDRS